MTATKASERPMTASGVGADGVAENDDSARDRAHVAAAEKATITATGSPI